MFFIRKTLKTDSWRGLLWSVLTAHSTGPHKFPELSLCLFIKTCFCQGCRSNPPCLLIIHLPSGHLSQFSFAPAGLASVNLLCPRNLPEDVSAPKGNNQAPSEPRGRGQKICVSRGKRRRRQPLLHGQPEVTEVDRGKYELGEHHVLQEGDQLAWRAGDMAMKEETRGVNQQHLRNQRRHATCQCFSYRISQTFLGKFFQACPLLSLFTQQTLMKYLSLARHSANS